jgi:hypothetical protein
LRNHGQTPTVEVAAELPLDIEWYRTTIPGAFRAKAKIVFEVLVYHSIRYCLGGILWAVWTQIGGAEIWFIAVSDEQAEREPRDQGQCSHVP